MKEDTNIKQAVTKRVLNRRSFAAKSFIILGTAILAIISIHLLLQYLNMDVYNQQNGQVFELSNRFDMDDESSLPTWFSELLLLMISTSAFFAAWLSRRGLRGIWITIGVVSLIAAIDEIATLHEFVLQSIHTIFFKDSLPAGLQNAWVIIAPFILAAFGFLAWRVWQLLPRRTSFILVIAGVIFLFGALGVDMLTSMVDKETFLYQGVLVAAEESLELLGAAVAFYGIIDYIERHHGHVIKKAIAGLRNGQGDA